MRIFVNHQSEKYTIIVHVRGTIVADKFSHIFEKKAILV